MPTPQRPGRGVGDARPGTARSHTASKVHGAPYLVAPPGHRGDNVAPSGVPLHVGGHVVLCNVHDRTVRGVNESQGAVHTGETEQSQRAHPPGGLCLRGSRADAEPEPRRQGRRDRSPLPSEGAGNRAVGSVPDEAEPLQTLLSVPGEVRKGGDCAFC